jgi:hypothetical protein
MWAERAVRAERAMRAMRAMRAERAMRAMWAMKCDEGPEKQKTVGATNGFKIARRRITSSCVSSF